MLKTSNLACKYAPKCSFRKYIFQYQGSLNFADVSIFCKKSAFFGQISTFTQSNSVRAVLEIFQFCFQFLQDKRLLLMKIYVLQTMPSGIPLPDCSKLVANWKTSNDITIFRHDVIVNFFTLFCYFCQVQLLAQPSCHYDHWFWSYDNFFL